MKYTKLIIGMEFEHKEGEKIRKFLKDRYGEKHTIELIKCAITEVIKSQQNKT